MKLFRAESSQSTRKAFEELLAEHLDALYASAVRFCGGSASDAEDLLQDTVFRAFTYYAELRDPAAARAWLFTILTRTNLNRLRAQRRRPETVEEDLGAAQFESALAEWAEAPSPEDFAEAALDRERLTAALDMLPDEWRPVLWLSDVEEFRQREIAEFLGIPEGTVASRLFRARRALREQLLRRWPHIYEERRAT